MANELKVFENQEFGQVRVVMKAGESWFVAADVCRALDIANPRDAVARLDNDEKNTVVLTDGNRGNPNATAVNEPGLYSLVIGSRKPEAKQFKRWITHEVIPSIRKHGAYLTSEMTEQLLSDPDTIIRIATDLKNERAARLVAEAKVEKLAAANAEMQPKVDYYHAVINSPEAMKTTFVAKGFGFRSAREMNRVLYELGIQYPIGGAWVLYAKYSGLGYTVAVTGQKPNGIGTYSYMAWTQMGRQFLYEKLKEADRLPKQLR